jgi:hypothetical protein
VTGAIRQLFDSKADKPANAITEAPPESIQTQRLTRCSRPTN